MLNYIKKGDIIDYTNATAAAIASGDVVVMGTGIGVALSDIAVNATGSLQVTGLFSLAALAGQAWTKGDDLFWDATNERLTLLAIGNTYAGKAVATKTSTATERVLLLGLQAVENHAAKRILYTNGTGAILAKGAMVSCVRGVGVVAAAIAISGVGELIVEGPVVLPKKAGAINAGLPVGYDNDGDPQGGEAGSGAATVFLADANLVPGSAIYAAGATAETVTVDLNKFTKEFPYWANRTYETKTATYTIDAQDTGKVIQDATDNAVLTMTAVAGIVGCDVIVQNLAADGGAKLSIDPNSNDKVAGPDIAGTDNKDHINTKATQKQGDFVHVIAGTDWFVVESRGIWATE